MKVLLINSVCGIKSTGRICTDLAVQLCADGHDCRIAYGRENVPERYASYALRVGNRLNVYLHGLQNRLFDNSGFCSNMATRRLIRTIREYDPDIIHLHNLHGYYLNVEILFDYLRSAGKPVIWTLHDCWAFTGHCAYFDLVRCGKWKQQCWNCPQKREYPASYLLDQSSRNFQRKKQAFCGVPNMKLITPSKWLADLTRESFLKEYPVEVIHNGIDLKVFCPTPGDFKQRYGLEGKKIVLGIASAWTARKGLNDLLKLADLLNPEFVMVLVGVSQRQKEQLPRSVIGICRTNSSQELAEIYTAADVLVNPTYEDNYPTVNLEAQACGTPVITYHTGGSVENVDPSCVVEQGDIEALARMIHSGTAKCKENLQSDRESMLKAYMESYRSLWTDCQ